MYCFIKRLHLISSFKITRSLFVPYAYVFIESIDGIILSPFEPKTFLLTFPVKTLCLSLLKLCSVLNIDFLLFMNSLEFFENYIHQLLFLHTIYIILKLICFITVFIIFKFKYFFYDKFFGLFCFFIFTTIIS